MVAESTLPPYMPEVRPGGERLPRGSLPRTGSGRSIVGGGNHPPAVILL